MANGNTPLDAKQERSVAVTWFNGTSGTVNSACPDPNGAVNGAYFVEFINGFFAIYDKETGNLVGNRVTDSQFWQSAGLQPDAPLVDPRIVFIPDAGRHGQWLALQLFNMGKAVFIATTDPNDPMADPRGQWKASRFPLPGADFPMLGYDANGVYIGSNTAVNGVDMRQPQLVFIPRANALAYPPQVDPDVIKIIGPMKAGEYGTNLFPMIDLSGAGWQYETAIGVNIYSKKHLTFSLISPQFGEILSHGRLEVEPFEPVPYGFGVKQPFSNNPYSGSDVRFFSDGSVSAPTGDGFNIWMAHTILKPEVHSLAVRWYRLFIDPMSRLPGVAAWGEISDPHYDYFNASILSFGKDDYTVLSVSRSGDSSTPTDPGNPMACGNIGTHAVLARETDTGRYTTELVPLRSGQADNYVPSTYIKRWGDYSTICNDPDPKNARRVWIINQCVTQGGAGTSQWCNVIARVDVPPT
jgi:hypothetical protein